MYSLKQRSNLDPNAGEPHEATKMVVLRRVSLRPGATLSRTSKQVERSLVRHGEQAPVQRVQNAGLSTILRYGLDP